MILMFIYVLFASYYSMMALRTENQSRTKNRFKNNKGILILIVSGCTVSLVVFPFESQTLQFMNENGIVNIYMIILSYMLSPNTKLDDEIMVDEDGNISVLSPKRQDSSSDKDKSAGSVEEEHEEEQGIEMKKVS